MVLEHTVVRTDKDTLAKLKEKAGKKSVPRYLRDIANGVEQVPVPGNVVEILRNSILKRLDKIDKTLEYLEKTVSLLYDQAKDQAALQTAQGLRMDLLEKTLEKDHPEITALPDVQFEYLQQYRYAKSIEFTEEEIQEALENGTDPWDNEDDESESDEQ